MEKKCTENTRRLIRLPELLRMVGLSRSAIYLRLNPRSQYFDKTFPRPVSLASTSRGAVAWSAVEVERWCTSRLEARG
ncbi:MAG: AlpA family phage regulatory protein [Rhodocyclaceae bacterium]|nr:MAG: AlpA family phage regulatory protein [Rhodocyclaceae bacterium]